MMKLLIYLACFVFALSFVSAGIQICIDMDDPSAPAILGVSGDANSRVLVWGAATDEPSCSGIDEYVISRKGVEIGRVDGLVLSFTDGESLSSGSYIYSVYAIDLIGRNGGLAVANEITIGSGSNGGVSGGSYTGSYVCVEDWTCEKWTECVGNEQRRLCTDLNECGTVKDRPETYRECGLMSQAENMSFEDDDPETGGDDGFFSAITGAVIGGGATSVAIAGGFLILILGGLVFVIRKKKS